MNVIAIRKPAGEMNLPPEEGGELGTFSLKWIFEFLVRRWILIAGVGALAFMAAFTLFMIQPPQYSATALVMMSGGGEQTPGPQTPNGRPDTPPSAAVVDSQLEVLRSNMLTGRLVDALDLMNDPEWNASLEDPDAPPATDNSPAAQAYRAEARQSVVKAVSGAITVRRRGLTYAAEISATSQSPERAAEIANHMVELFQRYQIEARIESAARANTWLSTRLEELRADVQAKENVVEQYRASTGLVSTQGALLIEQQITDAQASLNQARGDLAERQARYSQLQDLINQGGSPDTVATVLNSVVISQLRSQEATVARQLADYETRYAGSHPALANVRAELADIRSQIAAETRRIQAGMRNDVDIANARVTQAQATLDALRNQLAGGGTEMVRLRELEREAAAARTVYESFLQRAHELADQGAFNTAPAEMISAAAVPNEKSSPRLSISFVMSFALGLGLGLAAAFLAEALDEGFASSDDVERKTGAPALASIPRVHRRELRQSQTATRHPAAYMIERQMSAFAEAFRVLRTTILFAAGQPKTQVVAITSALPNEGKTTVSLCLSRVSALSGQRVLLIDCDLRRRSVKEVLDIEPEVGLLQVLSGEVTWREAIYLDEASGMCVLPVSGSGFTPKEIFGAEDMSRLIAELRGSFDLIVLDCAPVLAVAETRVAAAKADAVVVVSRWQKTPMRAVRTALQQLADAGANIRGVALNGVDRRVPSYYSYPTYDFSKS
ncbi:MAG: polysaccharide biosynthesis tyrosine autokinase [Hyphomonadaceae bacterium]